MITSPYLADADRYERTMHGWVDAPRPDAFTMNVRIADPRVAVELVAVTLPSPAYTIQGARGRVLVGPPERIDRTLGEAMGELAGVAMTAGFTRTVAEVAGARPGAQYFIDAAIEVARLARQVTRVPPARVGQAVGEGPLGFWRLDMGGWVDLPESCYTYRLAAEPLFRERSVTTAMTPEFYAPSLGAARIFNRTKVARLERRDGRLLLGHSMFDEAHSFQIWYAVDLASETVVDAGSLTPRLPYLGICNDPQPRIARLIGQRVDAGLRKALGGLIGGSAGCAQLYDLTADLLKLLTLPAPG